MKWLVKYVLDVGLAAGVWPQHGGAGDGMPRLLRHLHAMELGRDFESVQRPSFVVYSSRSFPLTSLSHGQPQLATNRHWHGPQCQANATSALVWIRTEVARVDAATALLPL
jgi:hypothetical protein